MNHLRIALALSFMVGALVPVIAQRAQFPNLWGPLLVALVTGAAGGWLAPRRVGELTASAIAGVFIGLTVDAIVDWFYFAHDRRLIGIEWIIWAAVLGVPVALASWGSGAARSYKHQKVDTGAV